MKPTKVALLLTIPVLALLLAGVMRPPTARAIPRNIITINPSLCLTLSASSWASGQEALTSCTALNNPDNLGKLVQVLRGKEGPVGDVEPEDFEAIDMDGGQMHELDGTLFIIAFVSNDNPVAFYADEGRFVVSSRSNVFCGPNAEPGFDFEDEDCNNDGIKGDGVVVATLKPAGASRGDAEVRVRQDNIEIGEPYVIVGEPHRIEISLSKTVIQTGQPRCDLFSDTASYLAALLSPETSPFTAKISDDDGTALSGAMVEFTISNPEAASVALPLAPSLDLSASLGVVVAPNVICGAEETGEITLTGQIVIGPPLDPANPDNRIGLDPSAELKHTRVTFTVVGPPTDMTLSASPAGITCDGATSSTVSATLTDADGNPAVNGNRVHWQVKALGSVNPLDSKSADGVATTALTPLAGVTGGVVVRAWVDLPVPFPPPPTPTPTPRPNALIFQAPELPPIEFERVLEHTVLVACEGTAPIPPVQPGAGQQPSISPPSTGSGGSSTNHWLLALPLTAAALLLMGTGLVLKRRAA